MVVKTALFQVENMSKYSWCLESSCFICSFYLFSDSVFVKGSTSCCVGLDDFASVI